MAQPFNVRAALCTAAVMFFFGALATGDLPAWMVQFSSREKSRAPSLPLPQRGQSSPAPAADIGKAPELDCRGLGRERNVPAYGFHPPCPGRALAPNGQWAVEVVAGASGVRLATADGQLLDEIPNLADSMPFVLYWSPRSDWFFANHYLGSDLERLRVFQIVNRQVIERSSLYAYATTEMVRRYPCFGRRGTVVASGWRWSRDGRRVAMIVYARPDACWDYDGTQRQSTPDWEPLWMIGDAETGRIDPASVRIRRGGVGDMPADGPYAAL